MSLGNNTFGLPPALNFGRPASHPQLGCPISRFFYEKWGFAAKPATYFRAAAGSRTPASLASFAALSVASQVKSGSLRPKCP
jgi:hypothetical protein